MSGQDAVAEVEDVPAPPRDGVQDAVGRLFDALPGAQENRGVEVALHAAPRAEGLPAAVDRHAPVEADDVAPRRLHLAEEVRRSRAEMDRRRVHGLEDAGRVGGDELAVVGLRQRAHPGVEELDDVGARTHLGLQVGRKGVRELFHQRVPHLRRAVHARLRLHEVAGRLALDEVAGDGERTAGEADDSLVAVELLTDEADGLQHEGHRLLRLGHAEPLDVGQAGDRLGHDRPDAVDEVDVDSHADDREHDVGEHHGRVHAEAMDWLQRHLGAELGLPTHLEEAVTLADLPILGQRPPGLAHEPDRRALDVLAPGGADQKRIGHASNLAPRRASRR